VNEAQRDMLENESNIGRKASSAYENFIGPFMEKKRLDLFSVFQDLSISNIELLSETKRQLTVLNTLDDEIRTIIETGKLASQQLSQEPLNKH